MRRQRAHNELAASLSPEEPAPGQPDAVPIFRPTPDKARLSISVCPLRARAPECPPPGRDTGTINLKLSKRVCAGTHVDLGSSPIDFVIIVK